MKQLNPVQLVWMFLLALCLTACAGLQPTNTTEGLLAMETSATTYRQAGEQAALANKIKKSQAQAIQKQADLVVDGVKTVRELRAEGKLTEAQNQYQLTADILRALQVFLASQGVKQ